MGKRVEQKQKQSDQPQSQIQKPLILTSFMEESQDKMSFRSFESSEQNQFLARQVDSFNDKIFQQDSSLKKQKRTKAKSERKPSKIIEKQRIPTKEQDLLFLNVFRPQSFLKKNNNTVRFLIDLAVQHLPNFLDYYPKGHDQKMTDLCRNLREWHLAQKGNVYNCDHLTTFFAEGQKQICPKITREVFNFIIRTEALNNMKKPRSQIKDRVHYLRVAKVFSLRCRHHLLCLRNQSR